MRCEITTNSCLLEINNYEIDPDKHAVQLSSASSKSQKDESYNALMQIIPTNIKFEYLNYYCELTKLIMGQEYD